MSMRLVLVLALVGGCVAPVLQAPPGRALVVGAAGHSFMTAYNADAAHRGDHPEFSWPTGGEGWSFASLVGATGVANAAKGGSPSSAFDEQVEMLGDATLVLASFTDSDLCVAVGAITQPTEEREFERDLRAGVAELRAAGAQVMLLTQVDLASVAEATRTRPGEPNESAFYLAAQECAAEPGNRERWQTMNERIVQIAADEGVISDMGAVARLRWSPETVSEIDGIHPSPAGLAMVAQAVWDAYEAQRAATSSGSS